MKRIVAKWRHGTGSKDRGSGDDLGPAISNPQTSTSTTGRSDDEGPTDRFGLFRLDPSPPDGQLSDESYDVDIVAIHGLNGGARRTWTHKNKTFWLQDLLPADLPGARIFTYGYPVALLFNSSVAGIEDFAIELLQQLADERYKNKVTRPIIFVCHSLGGIVFKEAVSIAADKFRDILSSIKGVIFLGTPHRGSRSANLGKTLGSIVNLALQASNILQFSGGVPTKLLEDLAENSRELMRVADDFAQRAPALRIVSFYETNPTPPSKDVIVGKESAIIGLPHEQPTPIWANHRDICRYKDKSDESYQKVVHSIRRIAGEIGAEIGLRTASLSTDRSYDELEKACISRLNTADTSNYESRIQRQAKGTLDWLKNKSEYITWEQSKISQLLWVTGHIGCGKTTMALYVLHTLAKDQGPRDIICRYFCDDKEMSYDATPLLRALIYQMVHRRSKLLRIVRRALDRGGIQMLHQFDALWDIFVQVACDNRVVSVSVIIDGIERYDRKTQIMLVDRISELLDSDVPARVKFFITSGPNAHAFRSIYLKPAKLLLLELEHEQEMIAKDINLFIHQRLELLVGRKICTPSNSDEIEQILINKAGRSFLWVSIVLPILEERLVLRTIDVISIAHELQPEIYPSFDKLLYSISPYEREVVGQLLRLIVVSGRALSGDELSILIGITPQTKSVALLEEDKLPMDGRMVIARLGPLIRDCNSKISLNYTTMKEYLVHLSSTPKHPLSATFGINLQRDTRTLVSACTQYLALHEFGEDLFQRGAAHVDMVMPSEISDQASTPTQEVADFTFSLAGDALFEEEEDWDVKLSMNAAARRYKLFDYAALHWATDFLRCGDVEENVNVEVDSALRVAQGGLETVSVVCGRDQTRLTNWLRYFWISKGLTEPCVPAHPLIVASYFGHIKTLRRALDSPPSHDDGTLWNCLFWASRQGHTLCVKTLLKHPNFPSALNPIQAISPFHVAAEYGHADVVLALIENDDQLNVNGLDSTGRTALSLAAANGHAEVVAVLFAHPRIKVNQPDKNGYMPVLWATLAKSERVMAYFLTDQRVDLDCEDKEKRTPLSWAAEECAVGVISKLIQSKRVNMAHRDSDGRTPISYAAKHGHLDVVQLLLDSEPEQASIQDNHGRNAHSWAASQPNSGVLHELWKCNPLGADVKDKDGWTPLLWAMDPPGYPENVTELLQCKNIDINGNDNGNRTPLSWAASCGYVSIARTLSRTSGIDLDSKDAQGRTPLSHAAGNGNTEIVSLLLSYNGVDVNSTDNAGRTPLVWAASQGCCEVISLLLSQPHINHFLQDKLGRLPIEVALAHGQDRAAQILQASKIRGNPRRDSRP